MNLDVGPGGGPYEAHPRAELSCGIDVIRGYDFVKCDAHHLPFRERQFETVYAYNLLEHVKDPVLVFRELRRIGLVVRIRQDGMLNLANYATPEHLWFQLPGVKFLKYPRTRMGIAISMFLRFAILKSVPRLPRHHQVRRFLAFFLPPNMQYEIVVS